MTDEHVSALLEGVLNPNDYFRLILDSLGEEKTQIEFLDIIEALVNLNEELHSSLTVIYLEHFSQQQQQPSSPAPKRLYKETDFYEERYNSDLTSVGFQNVLGFNQNAGNRHLDVIKDDDDDDDDCSVYIVSDHENDFPDDVVNDASQSSSLLYSQSSNLPNSQPSNIPNSRSSNLPNNSTSESPSTPSPNVGFELNDSKTNESRKPPTSFGASNWIGGSLVRKPKARGKETPRQTNTQQSYPQQKVGALQSTL